MNERTTNALLSLVSIQHIAAAYIFDEQGKVLSREVPPKYRDEGLQQIALRILQVWKGLSDDLSSSSSSEVRLGFENFGLWFRVFGKRSNHFLLVFYEHGADPSLFRQPINLAVHNLERIANEVEEEALRQASKSELAQAAQLAEQALYTVSGEDTNQFVSTISTISMFFLGPLAHEVVQRGCRELELTLPIKDKDSMMMLVGFCNAQISDTPRKQAFSELCSDYIERLQPAP